MPKLTRIINCSTEQIEHDQFLNFDAIVVGAGFAGSVTARELAERNNMRVAVIEQRSHVGGNAYDHLDGTGVLVHAYGPHIFHTNDKRAYDYLSRFTDWYDYQHQVLADIHGTYTPVPFNFNSIEKHFEPKKAVALIDKLINSFGEGRKVPIIELREADDPLLAELADFVYQNVFLFYTQKQWGVTPEEVDPSVTARVPVLVGRDNRYFTDSYQGMPKEGYTALFNNMLAHDNISVFTNLDARNVIAFAKNDLATGVTPVVDLSNSATASSSSTLTSTTVEPYDTIVINNSHFNGKLIYTGPLDFLANKCFGLLPYRSLDFVYIPKNEKHVFPCGTVNYTVSEDYTRITEYTWLTGQDIDHTTIMEEYPREFADLPNQVPYYAILNPKNETHYQQYLSLFKNLPNFHALGRLAEYRYFNMDQIICRALELADTICAGQAS